MDILLVGGNVKLSSFFEKFQIPKSIDLQTVEINGIQGECPFGVIVNDFSKFSLVDFFDKVSAFCPETTIYIRTGKVFRGINEKRSKEHIRELKKTNRDPNYRRGINQLSVSPSYASIEDVIEAIKKNNI